MNSIKEEMDKLKIIKEEILRKATEKKVFYEGFACEDAKLISLEEDIALWKAIAYYGGGKTTRYFYTNLKGEILFDNEGFCYATPFSNSLAYVEKYKHENAYGDSYIFGPYTFYYIIDLKKKELVYIPLQTEKFSGFRNNNLGTLDNNTKCWGSYYYNREENTFELEIPFIWNALEPSRAKDVMYVGKALLHHTHNYHSYDNYDECTSRWRVSMPMIKMHKDYIHDFNSYYIREEVIPWFDNRYKILDRYDVSSECKTYETAIMDEGVNQYLTKSHDLADLRFAEKTIPELNNNKGVVVDVDKTSGYQRVKGLLK